MLKQLRVLLGNISQEEFARRIGVALTTVSRWERGQHPATLTVPQIKRMDKELERAGLSWDDIPDTFGPLAGQ